MQVVLVMFRPEGDRRSFSITRDITVIGRREDCDFRIPLGEISRKHCRLIKEGETLRVEDLGSSNGTFHNGERIQEAELQSGDTMQVGSVVFVVQCDGVPADEELQPVVASRASATSDAEAPDVDDSAQPEPSEINERSVIPLEESAAGASSNGEFDPMAVLDNNDSDVPQDAVTFDLEESGHDQQS